MVSRLSELGSSVPSCEICGYLGWSVVYRGKIRDGAFPNFVENALVARCDGCGVERLPEEFCIPSSAYETIEYRKKLQQEVDSESFALTHDELQIHTLKAIWPTNLRGKTVADIGCAAGSLLDHLRGVTAQQIGIEPFEVYRDDLTRRGYTTYGYASDAVKDWAGRIDLAFSMQVIEHTRNPKSFLEEIRPLLAPGGKLVISTPNRDDILFDLLPKDFAAFFYRVVHRWYFNAVTLENCARLAGYKVLEIRHVHRYGLANALRWLRDRRPSGHACLPGIDQLADDFWVSYLAQIGRSDCLYAVLQMDGD